MSLKNTVRVNDIESFLLFGFFFHATFLLFVVVFLHLARYFFVVSFCFVASCSLLFVVMVATSEACESIRFVGVYERGQVVFLTCLDTGDHSAGPYDLAAHGHVVERLDVFGMG
jgi:hypothetical protein